MNFELMPLAGSGEPADLHAECTAYGSDTSQPPALPQSRIWHIHFDVWAGEFGPRVTVATLRVTVTVRLTDAELLALRGEAERRGVTVGAALRLLIQQLRRSALAG